MTKFDINRFGKVLLWSARMTKKEMLTNMGSMFFAMFIPFLIHLLSSYRTDEIHAAGSLLSAMQFCLVIYFIVTVIATHNVQDAAGDRP